MSRLKKNKDDSIPAVISQQNTEQKSHEAQDSKVAEMMESCQQSDEATAQITTGLLQEHPTSIIGSTSEIIGDIQTDENLEIYGNVKGNITCDSTLKVHGYVDGTILCADGYFDQAVILGDVTCSGNLEISPTVSLNGNVEAFQLQVAGKIKGNATIHENAKFLATSSMVGDIQTNDIEIERGSIIQGKIRMTQAIDVD